MDSRVEIISSDLYPRNGYLSNDSYYGFKKNGEYWCNVSSYLYRTITNEPTNRYIFDGLSLSQINIAKRNRYVFEKVDYPSSSESPSKLLLNQKIIRKKIYNPLEKDISEGEIDFSIREKFNQNIHLLKKIRYGKGMEFKYPSFPIAGNILMSIRNEQLSKITKIPNVKDWRDVTNKFLFENERKKLISIYGLAKRIKKFEYQKMLYEEMFEDAMYIICFSSDLHNQKITFTRLMYKTKNWMEILEKTYQSNFWPKLAVNMPNFYHLSKQVQDLLFSLSEEDNLLSDSELVKSSFFLSSFIKWIRLDATKEELSSLFKTIKNHKELKITLPHVHRKYRENVPPLFIAETEKYFLKQQQKEKEELKKIENEKAKQQMKKEKELKIGLPEKEFSKDSLTENINAHLEPLQSDSTKENQKVNNIQNISLNELPSSTLSSQPSLMENSTISKTQNTNTVTSNQNEIEKNQKENGSFLTSTINDPKIVDITVNNLSKNDPSKTNGLSKVENLNSNIVNSENSSNSSMGVSFQNVTNQQFPLIMQGNNNIKKSKKNQLAKKKIKTLEINTNLPLDNKININHEQNTKINLENPKNEKEIISFEDNISSKTSSEKSLILENGLVIPNKSIIAVQRPSLVESNSDMSISFGEKSH